MCIFLYRTKINHKNKSTNAHLFLGPFAWLQTVMFNFWMHKRIEETNQFNVQT